MIVLVCTTKQSYCIDMLDDVNLLVEFVVMSVFIRSHKDNYYTIIPSIYVQYGDAVDCFI